MSVSIVGGYQTDFACNYTREGLDISNLFRDVVTGTLDDAGVGPDVVQSIHVGNAFGQLYTGQGHLGAMPATVIPEFWGVPAMRHEAACASASIAVLAAMAEIESGRYDCVLVVGAEIEKNMPGADAARVQEAAAWVGPDTEGVQYIWPHTFNEIAAKYERRYGLDTAHLRAIGELNLRNAKDNPNAQTRDWNITDQHVVANDELNPVVVGRLRRNDICQLTDGGAGVLLASNDWIKKHRPAKASIAGWGHTTVGLGLQQKLDRPPSAREGGYVMPQVRKAITDAWQRAGINGVDDLDLIETHDCMTPSEYLAIDHFAITEPGQSWQAVEDGSIERDGRIPINASGGLIGGGHPVGATGARMLVDATRQLTETAGDCQIAGAKRAATLNIGGSTTTVASFVVEAAA